MSKMSISKLLRPERVLSLKLFAATGNDMRSRKRRIVGFTKRRALQVQTACMAPSEDEKRDHSETLHRRTLAATCLEVSCDREVELEAMEGVLESLPDSPWLCASAREATQGLGLQPPANEAGFYLTCPGGLQGQSGI